MYLKLSHKNGCILFFVRYIEALLDYVYDYTQRVLPLYDLEGVSIVPYL